MYSSPNIIRVIKSRTMRYTEYVALMRNRRSAYRVLVGRPEGKNHLVDPGIYGRIILKWIFKKLDRGYGLDLSGSVTGKVTGCRECGNETSGSI